MKYLWIWSFLLAITIYCCANSRSKPREMVTISEKQELFDTNKVKEEVYTLMKKVLLWSETKNSIDLLPVLTDKRDSIIVGFDLEKLNINLNILRSSDFFSEEFIENYNRIILTLDRKLRNREFEYKEWLVGELPIFNFVNDINPWCYCQGFVTEQFSGVEIINLDCEEGDFKWKWTNDSDWLNFKFRVIKENNKWRISYLEGFDFEEATK
jgi:hypothetical protein